MNPTEASPAMRSLASWSPAAAPEVDAPAPADLLGDLPADAWLTADLAAAPRGPYEALQAAGTVGRLWSPGRDRAAASRAMARLMADDDPMARAARWAASLPAEVLDAAARLASAEVTLLADGLDGLDAFPETALVWLERRDGLASVLRLLGPRAAALAPAVEALDARACLRVELWGLDGATSPRLEAVGWQEPRSWWGRS